MRDVEYVTKDWKGLMEILRDIYPADIFTGTSGDPGPVIIALLRRIDAALQVDQSGEPGDYGDGYDAAVREIHDALLCDGLLSSVRDARMVLSLDKALAQGDDGDLRLHIRALRDSIAAR